MGATGELGLERPSKGFVSARSFSKALEYGPGVLVRAIKGSEGTVAGLSDIFAASNLAVRKTVADAASAARRQIWNASFYHQSLSTFHCHNIQTSYHLHDSLSRDPLLPSRSFKSNAACPGATGDRS
jgi:hypothetical protein